MLPAVITLGVVAVPKVMAVPSNSVNRMPAPATPFRARAPGTSVVPAPVKVAVTVLAVRLVNEQPVNSMSKYCLVPTPPLLSYGAAGFFGICC